MNGKERHDPPEITGFSRTAEVIWRIWDTMSKALSEDIELFSPSPLLEFPILGTAEYYNEGYLPGADRVVLIINGRDTVLFYGLMTHNYESFGLIRPEPGAFMLCKCK